VRIEHEKSKLDNIIKNYRVKQCMEYDVWKLGNHSQNWNINNLSNSEQVPQGKDEKEPFKELNERIKY
jgi:hypothetical protein